MFFDRTFLRPRMYHLPHGGLQVAGQLLLSVVRCSPLQRTVLPSI